VEVTKVVRVDVALRNDTDLGSLEAWKLGSLEAWKLGSWRSLELGDLKMAGMIRRKENSSPLFLLTMLGWDEGRRERCAKRLT
jgi:hypothetical protein